VCRASSASHSLGQAKDIPLDRYDSGVVHNRRYGPGRPRRQRLQLATGAHPELLNDRGRQDTLTVSEVSDIVTHGAAIRCLIGATKGPDFLMHARIGVMRAL
jgi:hypothetical protein